MISGEWFVEPERESALRAVRSILILSEGGRISFLEIKSIPLVLNILRYELRAFIVKRDSSLVLAIPGTDEPQFSI